MSSSILRYCSPSGNLCLLTLPSFAPVSRETLTARVSPAEPPKIIIFTRARLMGARSRLCALCILVELLHQREDGSGRHYALLGDIEVDVLRGSDVKDRVAELYLRIVRAPFLRGDLRVVPLLDVYQFARQGLEIELISFRGNHEVYPRLMRHRRHLRGPDLVYQRPVDRDRVAADHRLVGVRHVDPARRVADQGGVYAVGGERRSGLVALELRPRLVAVDLDALAHV